MSKDEQSYITEEKKEALIKELDFLMSNKRKEIIEKLDYAKSLGDLSENAEYHQAREEQGKLEDRIRELESIIKDSIVVGKNTSSLAGIGSTVVVQKEGDKDNKTYYIVGSQEADMSTGKISNMSPIGQALYGKKKGEIASVETPKGIAKYKIIEIE